MFSSSEMLTGSHSIRIAQTADISTITITGNQANGIGVGSSIWIERIDNSVGSTSVATLAANTFTGAQTVQAAATQDAIKIAGRAGGTSSYAVTITPLALSANRTLSAPDEDGTIALRGANTFTGAQLIRAAATQDAIEILGRAGGTSSYKATITPLALSASRTFSLPDESGTIALDAGWQDYAPTCYVNGTSSTTVPNITKNVRYRKQGKTLSVYGTLVFTGAPTGATALSMSLPSGVNSVVPSYTKKSHAVGSAHLIDGSGQMFLGAILLATTGGTPEEDGSRVSFLAQDTISSFNNVSTTVPFTWGNGMHIAFDFTIEIQ
jgi:hypothetical protein